MKTVLVLAGLSLSTAFAAVDVSVDTILVPGYDVAIYRWVTPTVQFSNLGTDTGDFRSWMSLRDPNDSLYYSDSLQVQHMAPGADTTVQFVHWRVVPGLWWEQWTASCSTYAVSDSNPVNDTMTKPFRNIGRGG